MELRLFWSIIGYPLQKGVIKMTETPDTAMSAKRDERFKMAPLSEYHEDLLKAEAFLARNTLSAQARIIIQSSLVHNKEKICEGVTYLAKKRNISIDEMWGEIRAGKADGTSKQESSDLQDDESDLD